MSLFISLLPIYIFGNLHCLGMCGPLVALMGRNRGKWFYLLGRVLSFSLAGLIAAELGLILNVFLGTLKIPAFSALFFGSLILIAGLFVAFNLTLPGRNIFAKKMAPLSQKLALFGLKNSRGGAFTFGFLSLALPCGQTVIVFSACAVFGSPSVGLINGCLFALFTTPALILAMHTISFLPKSFPYNKVMGLLSVFVGLLAMLRGFAELSLISHCILNPNSPSSYQIVFF